MVSLSRSHGIDLLTGGPSLGAALRDVDAVIDTSSLAAADDTEAERVHAAATTALLAAEVEAGVGHHVVLSIACLDTVSGGPHYVGKRAQERTVKAGAVPYTIVRATQFHDFPAMVAGWVTQNGVAPIAPLLLQPIAPADLAAVLAMVAVGKPTGRFADVAGPEKQDMVDMARRTLEARGQTVKLEPTWDGGLFGLAMAGNTLLPGERVHIAPTTFDEWLEQERTSAGR